MRRRNGILSANPGKEEAAASAYSQMQMYRIQSGVERGGEEG